MARTDTVLVESYHFYKAGEAVPPVEASSNVGGWYSLSAEDMNKLLNP